MNIRNIIPPGGMPVSGTFTVAPTSITPTTVAAGASASGTIPSGSVGWAFIILSGTGSLGGAAGAAGLAVGDTNTLKTNLAWTTDANSSAFIYYGTP